MRFHSLILLRRTAWSMHIMPFESLWSVRHPALFIKWLISNSFRTILLKVTKSLLEVEAKAWRHCPREKSWPRLLDNSSRTCLRRWGWRRVVWARRWLEIAASCKQAAMLCSFFSYIRIHYIHICFWEINRIGRPLSRHSTYPFTSRSEIFAPYLSK